MKRSIRIAIVSLLTAGSTVWAADDMPPEGQMTPVQAAGTTIALALNPMHPTRKQDTELRITFTDTATGKPVDAGDVQVEWSMDGKKHANKMKAKRTADPGVFQAKTKAPMNGRHNLVVTAVRDGQPIAGTFETHVMDLSRGMKDTMGH